MRIPPRRRLLVAATIALLPRIAASQQASRRVGGVFGGSPGTHGKALNAFRQALQGYGWHEGRNVVFEWRWAEGQTARVPSLAAEIIRWKPDVILTASNPIIEQVRLATASIPIVMATGSDPVAAGFVAQLARPGGNVTGVTGFYESTPLKMLELVGGIVPRGSRIMAVYERNTMFSRKPNLDGYLKLATAMGLAPDAREVVGAGDLDSVFKALARDKPGALMILPGPTIFALHREIVKHAQSLAIPVVYPFEEMAEAGGLMSYAPDLLDMYRAAARYVDSILRGAKPGDLPIEQPTRLSLAINQRTARADGIVLPESVLRRADRIIE